MITPSYFPTHTRWDREILLEPGTTGLNIDRIDHVASAERNLEVAKRHLGSVRHHLGGLLDPSHWLALTVMGTDNRVERIGRDAAGAIKNAADAAIHGLLTGLTSSTGSRAPAAAAPAPSTPGSAETTTVEGFLALPAAQQLELLWADGGSPELDSAPEGESVRARIDHSLRKLGFGLDDASFAHVDGSDGRLGWIAQLDTDEAPLTHVIFNAAGVHLGMKMTDHDPEVRDLLAKPRRQQLQAILADGGDAEMDSDPTHPVVRTRIDRALSARILAYDDVSWAHVTLSDREDAQTAGWIGQVVKGDELRHLVFNAEGTYLGTAQSL